MVRVEIPVPDEILSVVDGPSDQARFALHLLLAADAVRGPSSSTSYARLVRKAIGAFDDPIADGDVLLDTGDESWPERVPPDQRCRGKEADSLEPVELGRAWPPGESGAGRSPIAALRS